MKTSKCPICQEEFDSWHSMRVHQGSSKCDTGSTGRLDTESYIERYKRIKEQIPEKYKGAFEELTGQGKSPNVFQGAILYIESEKTLKEAANLEDTCEESIRTLTNDLIDRGVVSLEYVRRNNFDNGIQVFGEGRARGEKAPHTSNA